MNFKKISALATFLHGNLVLYSNISFILNSFFSGVSIRLILVVCRKKMVRVMHGIRAELFIYTLSMVRVLNGIRAELFIYTLSPFGLLSWVDFCFVWMYEIIFLCKVVSLPSWARCCQLVCLAEAETSSTNFLLRK